MAVFPTGAYLAVAHSASPYVTIYKTGIKAFAHGNTLFVLSGILAAGYAKEAGACRRNKAG